MNMMHLGPTRSARVSEALTDIAMVFGFTSSDLTGPRRTGRIVQARYAAMSILYHGWRHFRPEPFSLPQLGQRFCRDHTIILDAKRRYARWCEELGLGLVPTDLVGRARLLADHLGFPVTEIEAERRDADAAAAELAAYVALRTAELAAWTDALEEPVLVEIPEPPQPEPERVMPEPLSLPATIAGDLFGPFDALALDALDEDERQEAILLFSEKLRCEMPRLSEHAVRAKTALAFGLSEPMIEAEWRRRPAPRRATGFDEIAQADPLSRITGPNDAGARSFVVFAQIYLTADPQARFVVSDAYRAFVRFCRERREDPLPRSNFGAELKRLGGVRLGDTISELRLKPAIVEAGA